MSNEYLSDIIKNRLSKTRIEDRQTDELIGFARGLTADGDLSELEIDVLHNWLIACEAIAEAPLVNLLLQNVEQVFSDGVVSEDERLQLFETLREFTGIANEIGEVVTSTTLPLCHPPPRVLFDGCRFCFTGTFVFGSRRTCHEASCERGATVGGIAKSTDFLVIGAYATESWQHSSYGRKIEKAVAFRDSGVPISIISEAHWQEAL